MEKPHQNTKIRILFVCLGNICRSPAAETIFAKLASHSKLVVEVDSAGISGWHKGEKADRRMLDAAQRRGYQITSISRPVVKSDFSQFDLIVAMDNENFRDLMSIASTDEEKNKIVRMADFLVKHHYDHIPDPYYGDANEFNLVIDLLEDASHGLISQLKTKLSL